MYAYIFQRPKRVLDGVTNHFLERYTTFFYIQCGYEMLSNCVKLYSTLVPQIKNDRSPNATVREGGNSTFCERSAFKLIFSVPIAICKCYMILGVIGWNNIPGDMIHACDTKKPTGRLICSQDQIVAKNKNTEIW